MRLRFLNMLIDYNSRSENHCFGNFAISAIICE